MVHCCSILCFYHCVCVSFKAQRELEKARQEEEKAKSDLEAIKNKEKDDKRKVEIKIKLPRFKGLKHCYHSSPIIMYSFLDRAENLELLHPVILHSVK